MSDYAHLLAEASQLKLDDRLQLIEALWDTVPSDSLPPLSPEWLAEIKDRCAELDAGKVKGIPWEEVRDAALRRIGR